MQSKITDRPFTGQTRFNLAQHDQTATVKVNGVTATVASQDAYSVTLASPVLATDTVEITYNHLEATPGFWSAIASISGQYVEGATLVAYPAPGWSFTAGQWKRDGVAISGATELTYIQVAADVGHSLSFTPTSAIFVALGGTTTIDTSGTPQSDILYASKISGLLAAMKSSNTQRVSIPVHSMSIAVGAGTKGPTSSDYGEVEFSTLSIYAKASAQLNTARGGAFARGIETISSLSGDNPFFTRGGGATVLAKQASVGGTCGQAVSLAGGGTATVSFPMTSAAAGQVVKLYGYTTGNVAGVIPRYSLSGANTQATTALPASTTANPVSNPAATLGYFWYETTLTMANAGTTTVTLLAPTAAGQSFVIYAVDPDYKTTPGLTFHRASQAGETIATNIGASIDDTDTLPAGGNWQTGANRAAFRSGQTDSLTVRLGAAGVIAGADINDILAYSNNAGAYAYGWTIADHTRHLTNYVNAMASRGLQVLFVLGGLRAPDTPAIVSGAGTPYTQTDVINAYKAVAAASTNAAVLDLTARFSGATEALKFAAQTSNPSDWLAVESPRYVHPSAQRHASDGAYIATQIAAAWG